MACFRKNPLVREGTPQTGRALPVLDPTSAPLDERTPADFLLFARRYGAQLQFFDETNRAAGTWESFWSADPTVSVARLADLGVVEAREFLGEVRTRIVDIDNADHDKFLLAHFALLFAVPLALLQECTAALRQLPSDSPLRSWGLAQLARADLHLRSFAGYYQGARETFGHTGGDTQIPLFPPADFGLDWFESPPPEDASPPPISLPDRAREWLRAKPLASTKALSASGGSWPELVGSTDADKAPYSEETEVYRQLYDALNYNLFVRSYTALLEIAGRISAEATRVLETETADTPDHQPHYALWLTFLRLFRGRQEQLNGLTGRHLRHYYRDVLRLRPQAARANAAHVLFTLKRGVPQRFLPAGTAFRAGKDATNTPVAYGLEGDLIVNRATVAVVRSVYRPTTAFFESRHEALGAPNGPWSAGSSARIGFALSSPQMLVRGGKRTLHLDFAEPLSDKPPLRCFLTGEEGWIEVSAIYSFVYRVNYQSAPQGFQGTIEAQSGLPAWANETVYDFQSDKTYPTASAETQADNRLSFTLDDDAPQIAGFDPELHVDEAHPDQFVTAEPVLKIVVASDAPNWFRAKTWVPELTVEVMNSRDLSLRNANGPVDVLEPFALFGVQPGHRPWFAISSGGSLGGSLAKLELELTWEQPYVSGEFYGDLGKDTTLSLELGLEAGWKPVGGAGSLPLSLTGAEQDTINPGRITPPRGEPTGELRFTLDRSLGHAKYLRDYAAAMFKLAKGESASPPKPPYPARVTGLSLSFTTAATPPDWCHLHPFGIERRTVTRGSLLPTLPQSGALYLGIADWRPPERLTLLVEIAPGSSDPTLDASSLGWDYLVGNSWESADLVVVDRTNAFRQTGIVSLDAPAAADLDHTVLPTGLHWLRVSVGGELAALNRVVSIRAQAGTVRFVDHGNDPAFLATPLPAGTIAKAVEPLPGFKSVEQPLPAFGGRGPETDPAFRLRVSERLRHKDRAIQLWDYERLVLAQFPELSRVKCLNHTEGSNGQRAGAVTLVCLPKLEPNAPDPLRPFVRRQTLLDVEKFLCARTSPFVRLKVIQPELETLQVEFEVSFRENLGNPAYYREQTERDLIRELSPWAFGGAEVRFGGRWYKADLVNFLDELPYVDYVTNVKLIHHYTEGGTKRRVEVETAVATTPASVLISATSHTIHLLPVPTTLAS